LRQIQMIRLFTAASMMATLHVVAAPVAEAHHWPNFYCGESGDLCQSTSKVENVRKLAILTYAQVLLPLPALRHRAGRPAVL
jgi:hypothetical protein